MRISRNASVQKLLAESVGLRPESALLRAKLLNTRRRI